MWNQTFVRVFSDFTQFGLSAFILIVRNSWVLIIFSILSSNNFSNYLPLKCCFEAIVIFSSRSSMGLSCPSRSLSGSHSLCKAFSSNRSKIGYVVCGNSIETGKIFSKYLQPRLPRSYNFCWCQLSSFHRQVLVSLNTDSICRTAYSGFIKNCMTKINKFWENKKPRPDNLRILIGRRCSNPLSSISTVVGRILITFSGLSRNRVFPACVIVPAIWPR